MTPTDRTPTAWQQGPKCDHAAGVCARTRTVPCAAGSKTTGGPCGDHVKPPATVCYSHGGRAPQTQAAVERRREQEAGRQAVVTFGLPREIDPQSALLEEVHRTAGHVAYLGQVVADLERADLKQLDTSERFDKPSVWVEMYQAERKHLVRVAAAAIGAGIAERQVRIAEEQGRMLAAVVHNVATDLIAALTAEGVSVDLLVRIQRDQLPDIARRRLLEGAGAEKDDSQ